MNFLSRLKDWIKSGGAIVDFMRETPWDEIADLPEWDDGDDTQRWVLALLTGADEAADLTETDADDLIIAKAIEFVESPLFEAAHSLLVGLLRGEEDIDDAGRFIATQVDLQRGEYIAAGFPVWVIPIVIDIVRTLAQWIKDRDSKEG